VSGYTTADALAIARACGDWSVSKAECDDCPAQGRVTPCNGEPVSDACASLAAHITAQDTALAQVEAERDDATAALRLLNDWVQRYFDGFPRAAGSVDGVPDYFIAQARTARLAHKEASSCPTTQR